MENKRLIILFSVCFSIFFSFLYYILFTLNIADSTSEERTLYMNQVGLYEKSDSIDKMKEKLVKDGFSAYALKQEMLTAVVCSVDTDQKASLSEQKRLKELAYSYVAKSVTVDDPEIVKLIDQKNIAEALERIGK